MGKRLASLRSFIKANEMDSISGDICMVLEAE
jgi:hypothetical protein